MANLEKKLSVKNLTISFRTTNGKVQAVRGIDFELNKGETLAIVGESGSGKSVTSRAIMGILAGNAIVEGGEIIYDGKDLLKIPEEDFHRLRGDKIAMIFQDPMSSLNPIIKIGRQLTEAMVLKGKARQKESRRTFNLYLKLLKENMIFALANGDEGKANALAQKCKDFDTFAYKHLTLEQAYNLAHDALVEALSDINDLMFKLEKHVIDKEFKYTLKCIVRSAKKSVHEYVVNQKAEALVHLADGVMSDAKDGKALGGDYTALYQRLGQMKEILDEASTFLSPNFFAMGYYLTFAGQPLPAMPTAELNAFLRKYLDEHFMLDFIADAKQALMYSAERSYKEKLEAVEVLKAHLPAYKEEHLNKDVAYATYKLLSKEVKETIDRLEIVKDSLSYTFSSGLKNEIEKYFRGVKKNAKAIKFYEKQQAKYDKLVSRGKEPDWKVAPPAVTDLELVKQNIQRQIERLVEHFEELLAQKDARNYDNETVAVIDFLKANASGVVEKVTKRMAKEKALKLMEEVGIPEPRKRYNQYPYEFSGGMRQRIVIAIALAANPDILICDEPTTALDVTIQSQILELINKLKEERNLSIIFITHDLGVVANMADRIAVMYAGKIVEYGTADEIFYHPAHPYTWALLSSMPDLDTDEKLEAIPGTPPNMIYPPKGDAFAARNKYALTIDFEMQPPMFKISDTHYAATWLLHPDAPKVDPPRIITERIERMKNMRGGNGNGTAE